MRMNCTRMRMHRVLVLVVMMLCSGESARAQCVERWTTPRVLQSPEARPAYVEGPALVRLDGRTALFGTPAFLWADKDAFDTALTGNARADTLAYVDQVRRNHGLSGFLLDGGLVVAPSTLPNGHRGRQVIATHGQRGVTHVAWAEADAEDADQTHLRSLWYASYGDGRWSTPIRILSVDALDWSGQSATILTGQDDDVHVISVMRRTDTAGVVHLWRHNGRWTEHLKQLEGLPSQVTAQRVGDDSLIVAYAGVGDPAARVPNGQHIYLIRTSLTQVRWPPSQRIQWSGVNSLRWLRMYSLSDGGSTRQTLVWAEVMRVRGDAPDTLNAWQSTDRGVNWRATPPMALPNRVSGLAQTHDREGRVHVVTIASPSSRTNAQVQHLVLNEGRWSTPHLVYTGPVAGNAALDASRKDTLLFVWSEGRPAAPLDRERVAPVSLLTLLVGRCQ